MKNEGFKFSVDDTNDYKKGGIEKVIESLGVEYLQTQVEKLTQENQRLKERIEYLQRSISRKEETIRDLQNELVETPKEVELENRIDKAIKYIEHYREYYKVDGKDYLKASRDYGLEDVQIPELLELLKGENND